MRKWFLMSAALAASAQMVSASVSVRVDAPLAAHDDLEASSAVALAPGVFPAARTLRVELSLDNSVTGSGAELHLGKAQGGRLPLAGTVTTIGLEDGTWFIRGDRHRQHFTAANPVTAGVRTLAVRMRLDAGGAPMKIDRLDADGKPLTFEGLDGAALLSWLDPGRWDAFKVLSRGGANGVRATVKVYAEGTLFILR